MVDDTQKLVTWLQRAECANREQHTGFENPPPLSFPPLPLFIFYFSLSFPLFGRLFIPSPFIKASAQSEAINSMCYRKLVPSKADRWREGRSEIFYVTLRWQEALAFTYTYNLILRVKIVTREYFYRLRLWCLWFVHDYKKLKTILLYIFIKSTYQLLLKNEWC